MFADLHTFILQHLGLSHEAGTDDMAKTVAASLIHTRIDYANALIYEQCKNFLLYTTEVMTTF